MIYKIVQIFFHFWPLCGHYSSKFDENRHFFAKTHFFLKWIENRQKFIKRSKNWHDWSLGQSLKLFCIWIFSFFLFRTIYGISRPFLAKMTFLTKKWPFWPQNCFNCHEISHKYIFWWYLLIYKIVQIFFHFWPFFGHFSSKFDENRHFFEKTHFFLKMKRKSTKIYKKVQKLAWLVLEAVSKTLWFWIFSFSENLWDF